MLYPIMTESRALMDLSGTWDFKLDDGNGFAQKWPERPLEEPLSMPVPASYNDMLEDIRLRDHCGWAFYQRTLAVPAYIRASQRVVLRCDAVTHHAKVFLNGKELCEHFGGFLPFEVEIGGALADGDNLLTIAVDNRVDYTTLPIGSEGPVFSGTTAVGSGKKENHPNFDFFNYCGLTRPVRVYTTPKTWIDDVTLVAEVADPLAEDVCAALRYSVAAMGPDADRAACKVEVFDRAGRRIAAGEGRDGSLALEHVTLWQPRKPYLYRVKISLGDDVYELPYGIRTVSVEGTQFLINGRPFYFKGYGKHEDTFPNGRGLNPAMNAKDCSIMKWQGANSFRCSHYPYSEEMMRLADAEGFVVIDETTAVGLNFEFGGGANFSGQKYGTYDPDHGVKTFEHHKDVIRDLIARDKNYACVVMWNIANEPDSFSEGAYEYFKPLFDLARSLDPAHRPCTLRSLQMAGGPDTDISAKLSDVICLNRYYGWYVGAPDLEGPEQALRRELREWEALGKPLMFTEYGADTVMGLHDTTPVMFTEEYQLDYYKMNNRVFDEFPFVVGEHVWNFADFATSQGIMRVQGNKKGLFTRDRRPKLAAHYFKSRWESIPDFGYKGA